MKPLILIPAHNEAGHLAGLVRRCLVHGPVLVVDDGSTDGTADEAREAGAQVIVQTPNQGKGAALRAGFAWALERNHADLIMLDGDGQHDPDEIPALCAPPVGHLVIGARDYRRMPFPRNLSNTLGRVLLRWALDGARIDDNQSGYRRVPADLARRMLSSRENAFEFEVEMIARHLAAGGAISWVPIRTIYTGGTSHIRPLRHVTQFLRVVLASRLILRGRP